MRSATTTSLPANRNSGQQRFPVTLHLAALLAYLLATILFTWPLALNFTAAIPGDGFDGWQNYWNLWWLKQALVERQVNPLFTDILYHPTGVGLYFHTLNPFNGLVTLPVQLAFGLIPAYNTVVLLSWTLAGYGMFLLTRWLIGVEGHGHSFPPGGWRAFATDFAPPFLAGLIFTLSPFHMAHLLGHMQVMSLQWIPFYVLFLARSLLAARQDRPWLRSALLAALFLVLAGLCDWYFVLYLFLFTGLALLVNWLVGLREKPATGTIGQKAAFGVRAFWISLRPPLVIGAVFALVLSPWLIPMVREATQFRFMVRPSADLYILSASVMDFLVPNRLHSLFRPDSFTWIGNQIAPVSERTIGVGYVALLLALATLWTAPRRVIFWWLALAFFFMLALGPLWHMGSITWDDIPAAALTGDPPPSWTPYGVLNELVPFMRISRSVSRFALMVQLCVGVLAGLGLAGLMARQAQRRGRGATATLVALATAPLLVAGAEYWVAPYPLSPPDTPAYYTTLAAQEDERAVLNLPMNYDRPGYLLYQTVHGKPLTVAYISRDDPRTLTERTPVLQQLRHLGPDIIDADLGAVGLTVLNDLGVGTVVLDRYKMPGGDERTVTEAVAEEVFAGIAPVFTDERITVYTVPPVKTPVPYLQLGALHWGPLEEEAGQQARALTGPAAVQFAHLPPGATLTLTYRTAPAAGLDVLAADGATVLATLPPAPAGAAVAVKLAANATHVVLAPAAPEQVWIENLALR